MAAAEKGGSVNNVNVALLRGINVGGKNRLPMKELAAMFEDAGCVNVQTYIQSGNVLFQSEPALAEQIPGLVSSAVLSRFGFQVPIMTRTARQLADVVRSNPFVAAGADQDKLHVVFLAHRPNDAGLGCLDPNRSPGDEFAASGGHVYLHCPNGLARTRLTNSYFDSRLSTTSTTRNWRTTTKLLEMAEAMA